MKLRPALWILICAQVTLLVVELATHYDTFGRQNALALTNLASLVGILWFDRWLGQRGQRLAIITLTIVAASVWLDAIGNFQHLYGTLWWWDRLTHAIGGMAMTAVFIDLYVAWQMSGKFPVSRGQAIWVGFLLGQFLGAVYEISEFVGDTLFATQRIGAPFDSARDLMFNLMGGVLVASLVFFNKGTQQKRRV